MPFYFIIFGKNLIMDTEKLELLISIINNQSVINQRIEMILSSNQLGGGKQDPKLLKLRELITLNQDLSFDLEKKINSLKG